MKLRNSRKSIWLVKREQIFEIQIIINEASSWLDDKIVFPESEARITNFY